MRPGVYSIMILSGACLLGGIALAGHEPAQETPAEERLASSLKIDPLFFFQQLVERYRGLNLYRDVVNVVHVTQREGEEPKRIETQIACEVADGKLRVQTPASQMRRSLGSMGMDLPLKQSQPMIETQQKYDLWLAPHMTLKFTDEPLKHLRSGVEEGFIATEAEAITIDNKRMVHVELRSDSVGGGGGLSQHATATVNLYVNSESMLIERIETEQRLPDGGSYSTTLEITPETVEGELPLGLIEPVV
jgi:hypothetical protein